MLNMELGIEVNMCISSDSRYRQIGMKLELTEMFVVDEFLFVLDGTFIRFSRKPFNEHFLQLQNQIM